MRMVNANFYYRIGMFLGAMLLLTLLYDPFSSCPLQYRFALNTSCYLRDEKAQSYLIELYDSRKDKRWIAIVKGIHTTWYLHPKGVSPTYQDVISENKIVFHPSLSSHLLVNGEDFKLYPYKSRPE
jgi:hypothetical protein